MIGETIHHALSNTDGIIDATAEHPDGRKLVRVEDHWFFRDDCEAVCVAI